MGSRLPRQGEGDPKEEGIIFPRRGRNDPVLGPDVVMAMVPDAVRYLIKRTEGKRLPVRDMALSHLYRPRGQLGKRTRSSSCWERSGSGSWDGADLSSGS